MLGVHKDSFSGAISTATPRLGEESGSILVDFSGGLVLSELAFFSIEVEMVLMVWNLW